MANRKSLGSSPIGLPSDERDTLDFIPDLNGNGGESSRSAGDSPTDDTAETGPPPLRVTRDVKRRHRRKTVQSSPAAAFHRKKSATRDTASGESSSGDTNGTKSSPGTAGSEKKSADSEKKIVSYYLEKDLIERVKGMADDSGSYYSALVGEALLRWVEKHGY